MTLIDTSAWIDFFRGSPAAVRRIDPLLASGTAAIAGPVYAEVLSGAPTRAAYLHLREQLLGLEWMPDPDEAWNQVADARFELARRGWQASIVDLWIALTARAAAVTLLTRDRDFSRIREVIPLELEVF